MKKPKILVVGSINMDMICTAPKLPNNGETVSGVTFRTAAGGKGANQAVQAARLGADVTMVGKVGADAFGGELISLLKADGIDVSHISVDESASTGVADIQIEERDDGAENRILVIPGANGKMTADDVSFLKDEISSCDFVILQNEIPERVNVAVAKIARTAGVPVMLNPAPSRHIPSELAECVDYISPNEHEAYDMTGISPENESDRARALTALLELGAKNALITLGAEGCIFSDGKEIVYCPSVKTGKVIDPTAAGDSFIGAFCYATASGMTIEEALRFANVTASITVCGMGAQPSLPSLDSVLKSIK